MKRLTAVLLALMLILAQDIPALASVPKAYSASGYSQDFVNAAENLMLENLQNNYSSEDASPYQTKELIVQTNDGSALINTYGATDSVNDGNGLNFLQYSSEAAAQAARDMLIKNSNVQYAEPNSIVQTSSLQTASTDSALPDRWGVDRIAADRMKDYLAANNKTSQNLLVADVDTGVDSSHPFLAGRVRTDLGYNFVDNTTNTQDVIGHGTFISGIIADCTPQNVQIIPIKVFDDNQTTTQMNVALGIRYAADRGAKVINMSFDGGYSEVPQIEQSAIDYAISKGAVCVAAAGNYAVDTSSVYPANFPNVITVASVDENDNDSSFSDFGSSIDITAPGENISSCLPGGGYGSESGTSVSTPYVSAAAAMFELNDPSMSPSQIKQAVCASTVDLGAPGWDSIYGAGVLDFGIFLGDTIPETNVQLSKSSINVDLSQSNVPLIYNLVATVLPADSTNKSVRFTNSNGNVAVYNANNTVQIVNTGTTTITAKTSNGKTAICVITVVNSPLNTPLPSPQPTAISGQNTTMTPAPTMVQSASPSPTKSAIQTSLPSPTLAVTPISSQTSAPAAAPMPSLTQSPIEETSPTASPIASPTDSPPIALNTNIAYITGYGDGGFHPENSMTRAEVAVMLSRLIDNSGDDNAEYKGMFGDVPEGMWYTAAIEQLASLGIFKGRDSTWFAPDDPITRAEFVAVISRMEVLPEVDTLTFSDVTSDYWLYGSIGAAVAKGWITGYSDGTFHPNDNIKRVEAVTIINRMLERDFDSTIDGTNGFTDVTPDYWGYDDIMAASNSQ